MVKDLPGFLLDRLVTYAGWPTPAQSWARLFNAAVLAALRDQPDLSSGQPGAARLVLQEWLRRVAETKDHRALRAFFPMTQEYSPMIRPALDKVRAEMDASGGPQSAPVRDLLRALQEDMDRSILRGLIGGGDAEPEQVQATGTFSLEDLRRDLHMVSADLISPDVLDLLQGPQEVLILVFLTANLLEADHYLRTNQGPKPTLLRDHALQTVLFDLLSAIRSGDLSAEHQDLSLQLIRDASRHQKQLADAIEALAQNLRALKPGGNLRASTGFDRALHDPKSLLSALHLIRSGNPGYMLSCPWLKDGDPQAVKTAIEQHAYKLHFIRVENPDGSKQRLEAVCLQGDRQAEVIQRIYRLYLDHCARNGVAVKQAMGLRLIQLDGEIVLQDRKTL